MNLYDSRILIVDDEKALSRMVEGVLQKEGFFRIYTAADCKSAELLTAENEFQMILLDVMLPRLDGFTVLRRLRAAGVFDLCPTAAQAIGYKELFPWLDGRATRAEAVEALKTATRRYAKRQTTWFAARPYVTWVDADAGDRARNFEDIVNNAESLFS